MNNTKIHVLDELRRVLLPAALRNQIGWEIGDNLTAVLCNKTQAITLHEGGDLKIDSLGRVALDKAHTKKLGWDKGDKLEITVKKEEELIALSVHQKQCA